MLRHGTQSPHPTHNCMACDYDYHYCQFNHVADSHTTIYYCRKLELATEGFKDLVL